MPLYAPAAPAVAPNGQADCPCLACRFGHGRRHPARPRCYTLDTTDVEWQVIAAVLPWPAWLDGNGGRPEEYCRRLIVDAIFYVADNGQCRCLRGAGSSPPGHGDRRGAGSLTGHASMDRVIR
ncbi:hypothetical protein DIZ27_36345 [Streptomyces sp. NWU339]|nr:hypothetical protein DIZ27_36345 [Streptomyces sp. NWU339]